MKRLLPRALFLIPLAACGGNDPSSAAPREDPATVQQEFRANVLGVHLPGANHAGITTNGLSFLKEDIISMLAEFNESTDTGDTKTDSKFHTDNCRLMESFASVRERYTRTVDGLNLGFGFGSLLEFGTILHTTQDFYAHSNWVDAGQTGLLTDRYNFEFPSAPPGSFFSGMVTLQVGISNSWNVSLAPNGRVPSVTTNNGVVSGLITGTYDNTDGPSACVPNASIPHGPLLVSGLSMGSYLSKDDPASFRHLKAVAAATRQTTEEFCRLSRLILLRKGKPLYDTILDWLVDDRAAYEAACVGTPSKVTAVISTIL